MEENLKSKLGFITFLLIIIALIGGGYYYTHYKLNDNNKKEKNQTKEKEKIKIDEDKEYFYFTNEESISESAEIFYKDVVINLNTQLELTNTLEHENEVYKNNIKYISKELENGNLVSRDLVKYDNDDLFSLMFRNYDTYESNKYASLVINDFNYSCLDFITFNKVKAYVFDLSNGKLLTEDDLLSKFNVNLGEIKNQIKKYLNTIQNEEGTIKIDETINELDNYALYINEYNKLCISYLVKTNEVDYNEVMEVNL